MAEIVEFVITVEIDEDTVKQEAKLDQMLSDMEEVVGKASFSVDESYWRLIE